MATLEVEQEASLLNSIPQGSINQHKLHSWITSIIQAILFLKDY